MNGPAKAISWGLAYIDRRRKEKQDAERERMETVVLVQALDAKLNTVIRAVVADRREAQRVLREHNDLYLKGRSRAGLPPTPGEEARVARMRESIDAALARVSDDAPKMRVAGGEAMRP